MTAYKFGAIRSPFDHRDYLYRAMFAAETLPRKFSRRSQIGPARDQGAFGSCYGFAIAGMKDCHEGIQTSPLYIYTHSKNQDGIPNTEGTYGRIAIAVVKDKGICPEVDFPYSQVRWPNMRPVPAAAESKAGEYKIGAYARVSTLDEVKQSVFRDGPAPAALLVCNSFVEAKDGFIPVPGETGGQDFIRGGHAMAVVGYDDDLAHGRHRGYLEVRNSWGTEWGQDGYCWIPYDFFNFMQDGDIQMTYWFESWTAVDIIVPPKACQSGTLWIDKNMALLDGKEVLLDQAPTIDRNSNRTLVPMRFMAENMGYEVLWNHSERRIDFFKR